MEVSGQLSLPGHFTSRERASGTHWIGAGLDAVEKRRFLTLLGSELQPVVCRYTD
jgi:hypothetical protein